jgi:hypothetical protein
MSNWGLTKVIDIDKWVIDKWVIVKWVSSVIPRRALLARIAPLSQLFASKNNLWGKLLPHQFLHLPQKIICRAN